MATRRYPVLVATRVTQRERSLIDAAAKAEGITVNDLLRGIVLPVIDERVIRAAQQTIAVRNAGGDYPDPGVEVNASSCERDPAMSHVPS